MKMLKKLLEDYKKLTIELIDEMPNIEKIGSLVDERKNILDNIRSLECNMEDIESMVRSLNIIESDEILISKIKKEKVNTRKALDNVQKLKKAREIYDKEEGTPVYFNRKSY